MKYHLTVNETAYEVEIEPVEGDRLAVSVNGEPYQVAWQRPAETTARAVTPPTAALEQKAAPAPAIAMSAPAAPHRATAGGGGSIVAPIPGLILDIKVSVGEAVEAGQSVAVIEAMKMENSLTSTVAGTVKEIRVLKGAQVATGEVIMVIG
ncbi:MAG: biotin/lipoyl-containing protein [Desulfobacterales bacterium]